MAYVSQVPVQPRDQVHDVVIQPLNQGEKVLRCLVCGSKQQYNRVELMLHMQAVHQDVRPQDADPAFLLTEESIAILSQLSRVGPLPEGCRVEPATGEVVMSQMQLAKMLRSQHEHYDATFNQARQRWSLQPRLHLSSDPPLW